MQSNLNLCRVWKDEIYKFMKNVAAWIDCLDLCRNPSRHIYFSFWCQRLLHKNDQHIQGVCPIQKLPACYHRKLLASFYWDTKIQDWIQSSIQLQHLSGTVFWLSSTHHFVSLEIVEENYACWNDIKSLNNSDNLQ